MKKIIFIILFFCISINNYAQKLDANTYYLKALEDCKQEQYSNAYINMQKALELSPTNTTYKNQMADILYKNKSYKEALKYYKENDVFDDTKGTARLCELYTKNKLYQDAIDVSKKVNESNLQTDEKKFYLIALGDAYNGINYYPQAIETWEKVLNIEPYNTEVFYKLAKTCSDLTKYDASLHYYKLALKADSKNYKEYFNASLSAENAHKYDDAIDLLLKAKENGHPDNVDFNYEIANAYYEKKDFTNAIIYLNKARTISPYDQDVASLTAYSYYNGGSGKDARKVIEEMMKINPNNGDLYYLIGMTYQKEGKKEIAEKYFEQAFKLKPELQSLRQGKANF